MILTLISEKEIGNPKKCDIFRSRSKILTINHIKYFIETYGIPIPILSPIEKELRNGKSKECPKPLIDKQIRTFE
jgi:hypothetical protein